MKGKRYLTQWTAQFFVAAELSRRGYLTSFTLGNAPVTDIVACIPDQKKIFRVDVKGLSTKTFWLLKRPNSDPKLYFIFVYIPTDLNEKPHYYIMTSSKVTKRWDTNNDKAQGSKGWVKAPGLYWKDTQEFEDCWDTLPK
jgi:hypothetical protein